MKIFLVSAIAVLIIALILTGCSGSFNLEKTASIGSMPAKTDTGPTVNSNATQIPAPTPTPAPVPIKTSTLSPSPSELPLPKGSEALPSTDPDMTLESLINGSESEGYKTDRDIDLSVIPDDQTKAAAGFNINYSNAYSEMQIRVFEFKTAEDALTYAKYLNSSGEVLAIVNGKFVTGTRATYGIIDDDQQKDFLEKLMKSKVMLWTGFTPKSSYTKDYKGTLEFAKDVSTAYDIVLKRSVAAYLKTLPADSPNSSLRMASFASPFNGNTTMYPAFSEDKAIVDQYLKMWQSFGVTDLKFNSKPNDYTMTGKRAGMDEAFNVHAQYDPAKGSIKLVDITGGKQVLFYEFVPLGNDKFAVQSDLTRVIVEYRNGQVYSFTASKNADMTYTVSSSGDMSSTPSNAYDASKDSIYPTGSGADETWVTKAGVDSYEQVLSFDGKTTKLDIKGTFENDPRIKVNIPKQ